MIKESAQRLLEKKEITQEEFSWVEKYAEEIEKDATFAELASQFKNVFASSTPAAASKVGIIPKILHGGVLATAGLGLAGGAAYTASELLGKLKQKYDINQAYKQMIDKVPALQEYPQDKIKDYFDVVKTFSPKSAANPLVAGALVHKMLEFGGVDHKLVQDIANIQESVPAGFLFEVAKGVPGHLTKSLGLGYGSDQPYPFY